jgi:hypothetical protein
MTTTTAAETRRQLLGAWKLVSWQQIHEDGSVAYPLGDDAAGQLMYTDSGHVSAQLVRARQPRFASDDWQQATADEMAGAWPGYFGYFGTFSVDIDAGAVIHHVQAGWFPNVAETEQVRRFHFQDGLLVLDAETAWGVVRIIWERTPAP